MASACICIVSNTSLICSISITRKFSISLSMNPSPEFQNFKGLLQYSVRISSNIASAIWNFLLIWLKIRNPRPWKSQECLDSCSKFQPSVVWRKVSAFGSGSLAKIGAQGQCIRPIPWIYMYRKKAGGSCRSRWCGMLCTEQIGTLRYVKHFVYG